MKKLLFVLLASLSVIACDESGGLFNFSLDTNINKEIVVDVPVSDLKNSVHPFVIIDTIKLDDNSDLQDYLDQINELSIKSTSYTLTKLQPLQSITELTIEIIDAGTIVTAQEISENNVSVNCVINDAILATIENKLLVDNKLIIKISGKSTNAPMQFVVKLDFLTALKIALSK